MIELKIKEDVKLLTKLTKIACVSGISLDVLLDMSKLTISHLSTHHLKERLGKTIDYDCPQNITNKELREDIQHWGKYKTDLIDHTYRSQFVHRNKQNIISALRDN